MDARVSNPDPATRRAFAPFVPARRRPVAARLGAPLKQRPLRSDAASGPPQDAAPRSLVPGSWLPHSTSGFRAFGIYDSELEDMGQRR